MNNDKKHICKISANRLLLTTGILVRPVVAVRLAVAEKLLVNTDSVTTGELVGVAEGLVRV